MPDISSRLSAALEGSHRNTRWRLFLRLAALWSIAANATPPRRWTRPSWCRSAPERERRPMGSWSSTSSMS